MLSHLLFCVSYVGFGGTEKGHVLGIPKDVWHNRGSATVTFRRLEEPTEEFEILVELEVFRTDKLCRNIKFKKWKFLSAKMLPVTVMHYKEIEIEIQNCVLFSDDW